MRALGDYMYCGSADNIVHDDKFLRKLANAVQKARNPTWSRLALTLATVIYEYREACVTVAKNNIDVESTQGRRYLECPLRNVTNALNMFNSFCRRV